MNFQEVSSNKLELPIIIERLESIAVLDSVKNKILNLKAMNNLESIREELNKVDEAQLIITRLMRAPIYLISNYDKILKLLEKEATLDAIDLYQTVRLYETIKSNQKFAQDLLNNKIESKYYQNIVSNLYFNETIFNVLIKSIDENGSILDDASPTLKKIRKQISQIDISLKQKLQEIIAANASKLSQTSIVLRDDRYCLAVKIEYKNNFKGIIHDMSASMQTVFIEPLIASQLMNDKAKLIEEEKEEVYKILKNLSSILSSEVESLQYNWEIIKEIDFVFAKAYLSTLYDGSKPNLNTDGQLNLIQARHPLLKVKKIIPNNITFGNGYLGIIVTGPNTGGKTVLLKTVGLLCLMVKYGLLIPASSKSNVMIFDQIFCDIGDDQSIANNLSTFSSHLTNITNIVNQVTPRSLVLFDEIGSGTDPIEGSNLAKAILKYLIKEKVSFITTTHYSDLKAFGFENSDVINASMEFDQNTLSPTYNLKLGISGASNAFNIAKRLGLKEEIIKDAEEMTTTSHNDVKKIITNLEIRAKELTDQMIELDNLKKDNFALKKEYDLRLSNIEVEKQRILNNAQKKADEFIEKVTREALDTLEKVKNLKTNDSKLHQIIDAKHQVDNLSQKIELPKKKKSDNEYIDRKISIGDDVFIENYGQYGVVEKILKDDLYQISIGNISLTLASDEIKIVKNNVVETSKSNKVSFDKAKTKVSMTLDLRGKRYEEARDLLDKYIDDLLVVGLKQASIIHGFGTGVIRELVQTYVKNNKNISSYRYGGGNEGGLGVTVIMLK